MSMASVVARGSITRSVHVRVGLFDLLLVVAGVAGWSLIDSIDPVVLSLAMVLRWGLTQLILVALLGPLRRWRAHADQSPAEVLTAADEALQVGVMRFVWAYALCWVLTSGLAFLVTVAMPSLGMQPGNAEYLIMAMGLLVVLSLAYAFMLPVIIASTHELVLELGTELRAKRLELDRPARSFASILRNFTLAFTVGMMVLAYGLAGKGRIDSERERAIAAQTGRVAAAALDFAEDGRLEPSEPGEEPIEWVGSAELPDLLGFEPGAKQLAGFDPEHEQVVAALAIGEDQWLVARGTADEQLPLFAALMASLTLVLGAAAGLSAAAISRILTGPLDRIRAVARRMVEVGDLRAIERPLAPHNDEVGSLINDLNSMLDSLEQLTEVAEAVAMGSLDVEIDHPGDLHEAFRVMLQQLAAIVGQLRETALEASTASVELNASMQAQERGAVQMAADVERSATKIGSLAGSAQRISDAADHVLGYAEQSLANVEVLAAKSAALNEETAGITELMERIREIADRSDLLALNGSLEATRAGEGGRGFGLVAAEMRRLAERVTLTVADVRARVSDIEVASVAANRATDTSRALAEAAAQAAREIASLTRAQTEDTRDVSTTTADMAEFVRESSAGMTQISATAQGLLAHLDELEQLTASFELEAD